MPGKEWEQVKSIYFPWKHTNFLRFKANFRFLGTLQTFTSSARSATSPMRCCVQSSFHTLSLILGHPFFVPHFFLEVISEDSQSAPAIPCFRSRRISEQLCRTETFFLLLSNMKGFVTMLSGQKMCNSKENNWHLLLYTDSFLMFLWLFFSNMVWAFL